MNILQIIVQNKLRSGGAIQMYLLSRELVRRGHRVCALYNEKGHIPEDFAVFEGTGIDLRFQDMNRVKLARQSFNTVRTLRTLIKEEKFDLIHAHKGNAVDLAWCATIGMDIPIITNRGVDIPLNYFQSFKYRSRKVKRIIAVSQAVKDVMVETGHIDAEKIQVVYGSVDIERFSPSITSTLREECGIRADAPIIGFVGNPHPRKGLAYLLEAFEKAIAQSYPGSVLVLLGVTSKDVDTHSLPWKIRNRIFPLGFRPDVPNCMAAFDVFVFPGIQDEGLTGTVREAAAMGLPIVTTDVAGNTELISHGVNGLVVPKRDSNAISRAVIRLLDIKDEANEYGCKARSFVETHMSNDVRVSALEHIYRGVLNGNGHRQ